MIPLTGQITHWLWKARHATDLADIRDSIDRALLLTRRMHHHYNLNRKGEPMLGAVVVVVPALLAAGWVSHRLVSWLRRSLDR